MAVGKWRRRQTMRAARTGRDRRSVPRRRAPARRVKSAMAPRPRKPRRSGYHAGRDAAGRDPLEPSRSMARASGARESLGHHRDDCAGLGACTPQQRSEILRKLRAIPSSWMKVAVGLYLAPPDRALVLCVDAVRPPDRPVASSPGGPFPAPCCRCAAGHGGAAPFVEHRHDYKRRNGIDLGQRGPRFHRHEAARSRLAAWTGDYPARSGPEIAQIPVRRPSRRTSLLISTSTSRRLMDIYGTHKTKAIRDCVRQTAALRRPMVHTHQRLLDQPGRILKAPWRPSGSAAGDRANRSGAASASLHRGAFGIGCAHGSPKHRTTKPLPNPSNPDQMSRPDDILPRHPAVQPGRTRSRLAALNSRRKSCLPLRNTGH